MKLAIAIILFTLVLSAQTLKVTSLNLNYVLKKDKEKFWNQVKYKKMTCFQNPRVVMQLDIAISDLDQIISYLESDKATDISEQTKKTMSFFIFQLKVPA